MEELLDLMIDGDSPSEISDTIKDILYAKAADKIEQFRPEVAQSLFSTDDWLSIGYGSFLILQNLLFNNTTH